MNKHFLSASVACAALSAAGLAQASVLFDFQNGQTIDVGSWDWTQTSFAAVNGVAAIQDFISSNGNCAGTTTGCQYTIYSHARLTGVKDVNSTDVTIAGLGSAFEITTVFSFTERVSNILGNIATFDTVTTGPAFLEVYYDTTPDTVDLTGHGFNDGRLILAGMAVADAAGNFQTTSFAVPNRLDQFPDDNAASDNYPGQDSVTGFGGNGEIAFDGLTQDFDYFESALLAFGFAFNNIAQAVPFSQVDPSDCFTQAASGAAVGQIVPIAGAECVDVHVDGTYADNSPDANGGYVPAVGDVNGFDGPDFVAQVDFNTSFVSTVPAPTPLALLGFGVIGLAAVRRRARK